MKTEFNQDIKKGKLGEMIFEQNYLKQNNFKYVNVSNWPFFRKKGIDFNCENLSFDIKCTYKDNNRIIIEEDSSESKKGWIYTSEADTIVFLSEKKGSCVFLDIQKGFKDWYEENKEKFLLKKNKVSFSGERTWQSTYRILDITSIPSEYVQSVTICTNIA